MVRGWYNDFNIRCVELKNNFFKKEELLCWTLKKGIDGYNKC